MWYTVVVFDDARKESFWASEEMSEAILRIRLTERYSLFLPLLSTWMLACRLHREEYPGGIHAPNIVYSRNHLEIMTENTQSGYVD